jgi:GH24 family phage-related lysozyme (muramidase)
MNAVFSNGPAEDNQTLPSPHDAGAELSPGADAGPGNIDKIRDILFGSNMRDYEQRFARLEEALKKESSDLRETTRRHLETLETFIHKELAALDMRLNAERDERGAAAVSILRKIGEMENHEAQAKREIRNDLLQQSKELTDAIRAKGEELIALLERRAQELQHAKTDRAALAGLFNEVAVRLTDQFKVTGD